MILRFRTTDSAGAAHFLAFNTDTQGYTADEAEVCGMPYVQPADIPSAAYFYILEELSFNCYGYTDNIYEPPDTSGSGEDEDLPLF